MPDSKKVFTEKELLDKAAKYCAYQERSEADVRKRLRRWDTSEEHADHIISVLREGNFIDDRRFAHAFARGRFLLKKWGRVKIRFALIQHGISTELADECIYAIGDDAYLETLRDLMASKAARIKSPSLRDKSRVFNYLRSKGYEYDLIISCWEELFSC